MQILKCPALSKQVVKCAQLSTLRLSSCIKPLSQGKWVQVSEATGLKNGVQLCEKIIARELCPPSCDGQARGRLFP